MRQLMKQLYDWLLGDENHQICHILISLYDWFCDLLRGNKNSEINHVFHYMIDSFKGFIILLINPLIHNQNGHLIRRALQNFFKTLNP